MAMVVDVAGRGQCRDVTAAQGAVIREAQFGPATLMANCVPPLMGLHPADRGDAHPAMAGACPCARHGPIVPTQSPGTGQGITRQG